MSAIARLQQDNNARFARLEDRDRLKDARIIQLDMQITELFVNKNKNEEIIDNLREELVVDSRHIAKLRRGVACIPHNTLYGTSMRILFANAKRLPGGPKMPDAVRSYFSDMGPPTGSLCMLTQLN